MSIPAAEVPYKNTDKVTINVYCHRHLATPWTNDFTASQRTEDVVARIWTEELSKILVEGSVDRQEVNLYHIPSGIVYAPEETFIDRLGQYFKNIGLNSVKPIKSTVTRLITLVPSPAHNLPTHIYFVLSVPDSSGAPILPGFDPEEESDEEESVVGELGGITLLEPSELPSANKRVSQYARDVTAPSHAAQLKVYARRQNRAHAFYDGRYHYNKEKDTRAPPVVVLHPSFALFLERLNDPSVVLDEELIHGTYEFMVRSSAI
ncbi:hypothetical protein C8T65DRAFT_58502 [Cerioporus squamosus]|nr:hypothetical protein C8T65DRAFT_58502 [Cerioporus squamosus]